MANTSGKSKQSAAKESTLPFMRDPDVLGQRYRIITDNPVPQLDRAFAKAYEVIDDANEGRNLYALVCDNGMPARRGLTEKLAGDEYVGFANVIAADFCTITSLRSCSFVIILDRPSGLRLSSVLADGQAFTEKFIIKEVLLPFSEILQAIHAEEEIHGNICPNNIFYDSESATPIILGECFASPPGFEQPDHYETLNRITIHGVGKGNGHESVDYFALGNLVLHMMLGYHPAEKTTIEEFTERSLTKGSYNTLVGNREFSGMMDDLLKGLLADSAQERWDAEHLRRWLAGKKYNLLRPAPPREAPRPFPFIDVSHFNRRHLTFNFQRNWSEAKGELRDKKLQRWVELTVKRIDDAKHLERIREMTGGDTGKLPSDDDDLISKSLIVLDPGGPMRMKEITFYPTHLGLKLHEAINENKATDIKKILQLIENDAFQNWLEHTDYPVDYRASEVIWAIDKRRQAFKYKGLGFGYERILYDLIPELPCQSPIIKRFGCYNFTTLLYAMNELPFDRTRDKDPFDKHICAFIGSRLPIFHEVTIPLKGGHPGFRTNQTIKAMMLLSAAQKKVNNPPLPSLCRWFVERSEKVIQMLHSRTLQREIKEELERTASKGNLGAILKLIVNQEVIRQDDIGFERAQKRYYRNAEKINKLNEKGTLEERASSLGGKTATLIGMVILTIVTLQILGERLHF